MLTLKAWAVWAFILTMAGIAALNAVNLARIVSQFWQPETPASAMISPRF